MFYFWKNLKKCWESLHFCFWKTRRILASLVCCFWKNLKESWRSLVFWFGKIEKRILMAYGILFFKEFERILRTLDVLFKFERLLRIFDLFLEEFSGKFASLFLDEWSLVFCFRKTEQILEALGIPFFGRIWKNLRDLFIFDEFKRILDSLVCYFWRVKKSWSILLFCFWKTLKESWGSLVFCFRDNLREFHGCILFLKIWKDFEGSWRLFLQKFKWTFRVLAFCFWKYQNNLEDFWCFIARRIWKNLAGLCCFVFGRI